MKYQATVNGKKFDIEITKDGALFVNGQPRDVDFVPLGDTLFSLISESASVEVLFNEVENSSSIEVLSSGRQYTVNVLDERALLLGSRRGGDVGDSGEVSIRAPMPGLIVDVPVSEGDEVAKGQTVVILESMKMQNELKAPRDGVVQRVGAAPGESVEQNKVLITLS